MFQIMQLGPLTVIHGFITPITEVICHYKPIQSCSLGRENLAATQPTIPNTPDWDCPSGSKEST